MTCGVLSLISLALIGARFVQVRLHRPVAVFHDAPVRAALPPTAYTPRRATPDAAGQRRKQRPPVVLGVLDQAGMTRYCVATNDPLTTAAIQNGAWICKPLLGVARPADPTAACRFLFSDAGAEAKQAGAGGWRCLKEPA